MSDVAAASTPQEDPRPVAPVAPGAGECCESGCPVCVFDLYADELREYREKLAGWMQRHPDMD